MKLLDLTLPTLAENLALDEALLEEAEASWEPVEFLRMWESPQPAVVIGRSSRATEEVDLSFCRARGIPVLRRCSGGAAVVIGPGCFMYAVVLNCDVRPALRMIDQAHRFVLEKIAQAIRSCGVGAAAGGTSDLTVGDRKISGNSLRCKRQSLLYHGTILYQFPSDLIEQCLRTPPRQPDYRRGRSHLEFVANVPLTPGQLRTALRSEWEVVEPLGSWPRALTLRLTDERYARDEWNFRR